MVRAKKKNKKGIEFVGVGDKNCNRLFRKGLSEKKAKRQLYSRPNNSKYNCPEVGVCLT